MGTDLQKELEAVEKELQKQMAHLQKRTIMVNRLEGVVLYLRGKIAEEQGDLPSSGVEPESTSQMEAFDASI